MPRIVTALVLCLSAALLFAACGGGSRVSHDSAEIPAHVIVPQQGMNRLRLGLTEVQVQAKLGEPDARADLLGSEVAAKLWSGGTAVSDSNSTFARPTATQ